ncbi:MAG: hypothetical protein GXO10_00030 [Crenarchaeota archaeon]|nr:hypothetical protein [Thermoproteota archaeon]
MSCYYVIIDSNIVSKALEGDPYCLFIISIVLNPDTCMKILFDTKCEFHSRRQVKTLQEEWRDRIIEESSISGIRFLLKPFLRNILHIFPRDKVINVFICDIAESVLREAQSRGMNDIDDVKLLALAYRFSLAGTVLIVTDDSDLLTLKDRLQDSHILVLSSREFFRYFYSGPTR